MEITPISNRAFAVLAYCEETKRPFGITIDPKEGLLNFIWSFGINKEKAHREHFDSHTIRGTIKLDKNFPGCPHCKSKSFYICSNCGTIVCYHGQQRVTCPSCGATGELTTVESVELKGGHY